MDDDLIGDGVDLGDAGLSRVEELNGLLDHLRRIGVRRRQVGPTLPQLFDVRPQISHAAP